MPRSAPKTKPEKARCGLCGKTTRLIKTECCGNRICDDEDNKEMEKKLRRFKSKIDNAK